MSQLVRFFALTTLLAGCGGASLTGVTGNGKSVSQNRGVGGFKQLLLSGGAHVSFSVGPRAIAITADENLIDLVDTFVADGVLVVGFKRPLAEPAAVKIQVSNESMEGLTLSGGSGFVGPVTAVDNLPLEASGGSTIQVSGVASKLVFANASGGSEITVTDGSTTHLDVSASGASRFFSHGFAAEDGKVNLSGASTACVHCSKSITGNASGASTLTVSGHPAIAEVNASGGSRLVKEN